MPETGDRMEGSGMSKQNKPQGQPVKAEQKQPTIPGYRRCPLCWGGNGGYGVAYRTNGNTRYYRCCRGEKSCGHTWTATLQVVRVEHRVVELDGER
jgi:hypothetical protein